MKFVCTHAKRGIADNQTTTSTDINVPNDMVLPPHSWLHTHYLPPLIYLVIYIFLGLKSSCNCEFSYVSELIMVNYVHIPFDHLLNWYILVRLRIMRFYRSCILFDKHWPPNNLRYISKPWTPALSMIWWLENPSLTTRSMNNCLIDDLVARESVSDHQNHKNLPSRWFDG